MAVASRLRAAGSIRANAGGEGEPSEGPNVRGSMQTNSFCQDGAALLCDGVPLAEVARSEGTPVYVYSAAAIERAYAGLDAAFAPHPHRLHYALKANSTLAVARLLRRLGSGVDANSVGEIEIALRAGFVPDDIVFTGVGKRGDELERAVVVGVHAINAESAGEVERIAGRARAHGRRARVALRINPDVDAGSHPYLTTGVRSSKFGVPFEHAAALCRQIAGTDALHLVGLHAHVGSQILKIEPLTRAAGMLVRLACGLRDDGIAVEHVDVGGGVGIAYDGGAALSPEEYAAGILPVVAPSGFTLLLEPGRVIMAPAGVLLTRVVDIKSRTGAADIVVVDAGMTELIRPALYGAYHRIEPVSRRQGPEHRYEIVGPLCETSDTFGDARSMPPLEVGDVLAIRDAGAYGSAMASNYNRRLFAPEVLVEGGRWRTIRRRQTIDDMVALEE